LDFDSLASGSGTSEPSIPFVAPGYTKQPTLGSYVEVSEGAGSRYALEGV
jgi:hypothetical protein